MKTKEEFLEGKIIAIAEQADHIKRCAYMVGRISKYPKPKRIKTYWRRGMRICSYVMSIKTSLVQIQTIIAMQPEQKGLTLFANAE